MQSCFEAFTALDLYHDLDYLGHMHKIILKNKLKENFLIEQIMIVGDGEKFVSALIVPNFNGLAEADCHRLRRERRARPPLRSH